MAYNRQQGLKTERLVASGAINGGNPIRKIGSVMVKGGAAAGTTEWYDDVNGATPANKRGGVTAQIATWNGMAGLDQQVSKAFFVLDANSAEVMVTYEPGMP